MSRAAWPAGEGLHGGSDADTLQEVKLTVQEDRRCRPTYATIITTPTSCVGGPKDKESYLKVRITAYLAWIWGEGCWQKIWDLGTTSPSRLGISQSERGTAGAGRTQPLQATEDLQ